MSSYLHTGVEHDSIIILYFLLFFTQDVSTRISKITRRASSWRDNYFGWSAIKTRCSAIAERPRYRVH